MAVAQRLCASRQANACKFSTRMHILQRKLLTPGACTIIKMGMSVQGRPAHFAAICDECYRQFGYVYSCRQRAVTE